MENQQNHSNKGIVIAVLCLIIGVVLGAIVVNMKSPAVSQEGAAIKSSATASTVCPEGTIYSNGGCSNVIITSETAKNYTQAQMEARKKIQSSTDMNTGQTGGNKPYWWTCYLKSTGAYFGQVESSNSNPVFPDMNCFPVSA